jgi:hypothetical protein
VASPIHTPLTQEVQAEDNAHLVSQSLPVPVQEIPRGADKKGNTLPFKVAAERSVSASAISNDNATGAIITLAFNFDLACSIQP